MGININGKYLSHLRFADDIVLMALDLHQAQVMLQQLNDESSKVGLKMNLSKMKIKIGETVIERTASNEQQTQIGNKWQRIERSLRS